jgi:hypothetical protein
MSVQGGTVRGLITVRTEDNNVYEPRLPGHHKVIYTSSVHPDESCGEAAVTPELQIAKIALKPPCSTKHLRAELVLIPNDLTLTQDPRPLPLSCESESCEYILKVTWPRTKTAAQRGVYYNKALSALGKDQDTAVAYFAEASWGAVAYTAKTRRLLQQKKQYSALAEFLEVSDVDALKTDDHTKYRFLMAKVDAASETRTPSLAFDGAADALEIYPANSRPVDVAMRTLIWSANSYDPGDLERTVRADPALSDAFATTYQNWRVKGKPSPNSDSLKKQLTFTIRTLGINQERNE